MCYFENVRACRMVSHPKCGFSALQRSAPISRYSLRNDSEDAPVSLHRCLTAIYVRTDIPNMALRCEKISCLVHPSFPCWLISDYAKLPSTTKNLWTRFPHGQPFSFTKIFYHVPSLTSGTYIGGGLQSWKLGEVIPADQRMNR
jgi:hypothetical protein